ncbi:hypothetical protein QFX18_19230 [Saccharophagus degradans]|uniref:hypothetical protein n=1 Tax=Saccharophagus degradans TaxID=86304 RepID=UPI0024781B5B|nr:hypothetical protein [Saccharophagus degradans]WGO98143.1 hypothetical protein QFX18_19230 [Saccharophagus degradans]
MEVWQTILIAFGGNAALLGILAWVAKSLVSQLLTKDLEKHKIDLQKTALEHQVVFSRLHDKRAEVVAELYSLLVKAHQKMKEFVSPVGYSGGPSKHDLFIDSMKASTEFHDFYSKVRIYIPEYICTKIDDLFHNMNMKAISFGYYVRFENDDTLIKEIDNKDKAWIDAAGHFDKVVPGAKAALEKEFRAILGDN